MGDQWNYNYPPPSTPNYSYPPAVNHPQYNQWPQHQYQAQANQQYTYQPITSYPPPVAYNVPPPAPQQNFTPYSNYLPQYKQHQGADPPNDYVKELENYRYIKSRISEVDGDIESKGPSRSSDSMDPNGNNGAQGAARDFAAASRKNNAPESVEDLDFVYDDSDSHANEAAELYSYTENVDFHANLAAFEEQLADYRVSHVSWKQLVPTERSSVVMKCLDQLEFSNAQTRMRSARCILYIAQGGWLGLQSDTEVLSSAKENCILLYKLGTFSAFVDLLNFEVGNHVSINKSTISMEDSENLRTILSVLCSITEAVRSEKESLPDLYASFCADIMNNTNEDLLIIKLLNMLTKFCGGISPHFPIKKVLLLLWKLILIALGGMEELGKQKAERRKKAELPSLDEDSVEILRNMRPSSPPTFPPDLLDDQNQRRKRSLVKQSSLEENETLDREMFENEDKYDRSQDGVDRSCNLTVYAQTALKLKLPWKPKVHKKEIDQFLNMAREKYLGYSLEGDDTTLFGLPKPIHDSIRILKSHVYTSLAELQIQKEEEVNRSPMTVVDEIELNPVEALYQAMYPNLPQYMICLLKILLATTSRARASSDSIYILGDVLPKEMPLTTFRSMNLGVDVNRHKEIIVKAVSGILLLLMKHFKLNHIYQFEFMSQHLVFANCIPLILKFFNQEIMTYVKAENNIPLLDFPSCVLGDHSETGIGIEIGCELKYCWRNVFSSINLLRVLNKLCKWKNSRIMMLVVFKSAPILKRTLKMRHSMAQLYILKLLKMQTKYLGRNFRKSNLKTVSLIYQKVRHHLNDDWAYGNFLDAKPWDFQAEEITLRSAVDRFNNRRYVKNEDVELEPVDNSLTSALGHEIDFSDGFQNNYYLWLEDEVFKNEIEWDKLF